MHGLHKIIILLHIVFIAGCGSGLGGLLDEESSLCQVPVFRTGQTISYVYGDDGYYQKGAPWPSPRFESLGSGTVRDNMTGLIWGEGVVVPSSSWSLALSSAAAVTMGGYNDWRVPNRFELQSFFHYGESSQVTWLKPPFLNTLVDSEHLTSTVSAQDSVNIWACVFDENKITTFNSGSGFNVRVVRGSSKVIPVTGQTVSYATGDDGYYQEGVPWPVPRFVANGNGTITDKLTGLMWEQSPPGSPSESWGDAIAYAESLVLGGHGDWRVPNVNELTTLIHCGESNIAAWLNTQGFSLIEGVSCWTSTTRSNDDTVAFHIDMISGGMSYTVKTDGSLYVLSVRGGQ